jgi:hypothetical protein
LARYAKRLASPGFAMRGVARKIAAESPPRRTVATAAAYCLMFW